MNHAVFIIARLVWLEARRTRTLWLVGAGALVAFLAAEFAAAIAVTETATIRAAILGSTLRWIGVVLVMLFAITSTVREFDDKVHELTLALPITRQAWYGGKLLGFCGFGMGVAVAYGLLTLLYVPPAQSAMWALALACELAIVAAASLFALFTFSQVVPAVMTVSAFYLLARAIGAIRLMGEGPFVDHTGLSHEVVATVVETIAFVLPDLSRFASSDWLVHGVEAGALSFVAVQTLIYLPLLAGGALIDFNRRNW